MHDCRESLDGSGNAGAASQARVGSAATHGERGIANETGRKFQPRLERRPGSRLILRAADSIAGGLAVSRSPRKGTNSENYDEAEYE